MDLSIDTFHAILLTTATTIVVIVRDESLVANFPILLNIVIFQVDIVALEANQTYST
jgi:hypothetical protein